EPFDAGIRKARDAVLDDRRHLGRRKRDDRQPNAHRLADGEPETRVANRIEEKAVPGKNARQVRVRDLAEAAERFGADADEIERHVLSDAFEDVRTEPAAACRKAVDDDDSTVELAGISDVG